MDIQPPKSFMNRLINLNLWLIFLFSVAGAVALSIGLAFPINHFFYDGTNNLLMLGAVVIPAIGAPVFIYKPIVKAELTKIVRRVLDEAGGGRRPAPLGATEAVP